MKKLIIILFFPIVAFGQTESKTKAFAPVVVSPAPLPRIGEAYITGYSNPDSVLTANVTVFGRYSDIIYQWKAGLDSGNVASLITLQGATSKTYTIHNSLSGYFSAVSVTPVAATGGRRGREVTVWGEVMGVWILETGVWNDNGVWKWNSIWNDN